MRWITESSTPRRFRFDAATSDLFFVLRISVKEGLDVDSGQTAAEEPLVGMVMMATLTFRPTARSNLTLPRLLL
jgi:hypothetical protein